MYIIATKYIITTSYLGIASTGVGLRSCREVKVHACALTCRVMQPSDAAMHSYEVAVHMFRAQTRKLEQIG